MTVTTHRAAPQPALAPWRNKTPSPSTHPPTNDTLNDIHVLTKIHGDSVRGSVCRLGETTATCKCAERPACVFLCLCLLRCLSWLSCVVCLTCLFSYVVLFWVCISCHVFSQKNKMGKQNDFAKRDLVRQPCLQAQTTGKEEDRVRMKVDDDGESTTQERDTNMTTTTTTEHATTTLRQRPRDDNNTATTCRRQHTEDTPPTIQLDVAYVQPKRPRV